jgi:hypothetical protein
MISESHGKGRTAIWRLPRSDGDGGTLVLPVASDRLVLLRLNDGLLVLLLSIRYPALSAPPFCSPLSLRRPDSNSGTPAGNGQDRAHHLRFERACEDRITFFTRRHVERLDVSAAWRRSTYHKVIPEVRHGDSTDIGDGEFPVESRADLPVFLGGNHKVDGFIGLWLSADTRAHRRVLTTMMNLGESLLERPSLETSISPLDEKSTRSLAWSSASVQTSA